MNDDIDTADMLVGKSDQLDNIDLMSGPRDFTIKAVRGGNTEQPLNIDLVEFPRPWRPGLTMRRLLAAIWGTTQASTYVGKRVRLFRDTEVTFGKAATGGTRVSHASHLADTVRVWLPVSRGQFKEFVVEPLPDSPGTHPGPMPGEDGITNAHERVIRGHMKRTGIDGARVMELARQAAGRDVKSARDLSAVEADALIVLLSDLPDVVEEA